MIIFAASQKFNNLKMKKTHLLLFFMLFLILPAKTQLYVGGGLNYFTTNASNLDTDIKYFSIAPELGYSFSRVSLGLVFEYAHASDEYSPYSTTSSLSFTPYFRPHNLEVGPLCFFVDVLFSFTRLSQYNYHKQSYLVGLRPGLSYHLTDKFFAVVNFGVAGYSSDADSYGFDGWGVSLSMTTTKLGFYYKFW